MSDSWIAVTTLAACIGFACNAPDDEVDAGAPIRASLTTVGFVAVADAQVEHAHPLGNFGALPTIGSDGSPIDRSYLRFDVSGLDGPVTAAELRLYVTNGSGDGPAIHAAASSSWSETGITWNNQPGIAGGAVDDKAAVSAGAYVAFDVTSLVSGNGPVSVVLVSASSDGFDARSREAASNPPRLLVTTDSAATATVVADARVEAATPSSNHGASSTLAADTSPDLMSYLRVTVGGVDGPVASARLRLYVRNGTGNAPAVHATSGSWQEGTITWNNRPATVGAAIADAGPAAVGAWIEYDLTSLVTGDGSYDLALVPQSTDGFAADAREGTHPPQVIVEIGDAFSFTTVGDHGATASASAVLDLVPGNGEFLLSLGDLSYGMLTPESAWCAYVEARVGPDYPVTIVSGNHEDRDTGDGLIDEFVADDCLPNRLPGVEGTYAKEYFFDYPATSPLARVILISPGLSFANGGFYDYAEGSPHHDWTAAAIDDARARGIPWVIVGMHTNCITMGIKTCENGADLFNLVVERRVDLILQGHDHTYQRSRQLAHSPTCAAIVPGAFHSGCVADSGSDGIYLQGAGSVLVINGMGGAGPYPLSTADPEAPYFASYMTSVTYGLSKISVTAGRIDVAFLPAAGGTFTDAFSIRR